MGGATDHDARDRRAVLDGPADVGHGAGAGVLTGPLIATAVCEALCGSIPFITPAMNGSSSQLPG